MRVHAAGQHVPAGGVDLPRAALKSFSERDDAAAAHADVGPLRVRRGDHNSIPDDEIEGVAHDLHVEVGAMRAAFAAMRESTRLHVTIGANPTCFWRQS